MEEIQYSMHIVVSVYMYVCILCVRMYMDPIQFNSIVHAFPMIKFTYSYSRVNSYAEYYSYSTSTSYAE